jgi:hypothetical protein
MTLQYKVVPGLHSVVCLLMVLSLPLMTFAQQAAKSDADLVRQGALALTAAHGDKPRYGGKFISAGNEKFPSRHASDPLAVSCRHCPGLQRLVRTSPYDRMALRWSQNWPSREIATGQKITFSLHKE